MSIKLFVSCPKGVEQLLQTELESFGLKDFTQTVGGIHCKAEFSDVYTICIQSRLANRVVWVLEQASVQSKDDIYRVAKKIPWLLCFSLQKTFAVDFKGTNDFIDHTNYGALVIKDAIVDLFKEEYGERPNVDGDNPQVQVYAHLRREKLLIGVDVSGGSLHRRGYRLDGAMAPLKENLAAALLCRAGYVPGDNRLLVDPFCGSGTLLIEGLLIKLGIAPNATREHFGFEHLLRFQASQWQLVQVAAREQRDAVLEQTKIDGNILAQGFDIDSRVIQAAKSNASRAGIDHLIDFSQQALADFSLDLDSPPLLLVSNPPYGERLEERNSLFPLYQLFGEKIRQYCQGNKACVLSSDDYLLKAMALQKTKAYQFNNGAIPAQWLIFEIYKKQEALADLHDPRFQQGVDMVANRLKKNAKRMSNWVKQQSVEAYRVYDADMPEYAFALDCYKDKYQLTEYAPPKTVDKFAAYQRRQQFEVAAKQVFNLKPQQLIYKERRQQKGKSQYEKLNDSQHFFSVKEGEATLLVNLFDYLDTGLFLDHRPVRKLIAKMASGKSFLNLFSYTSAATVHAALGGAKYSVSVDMSNTYIEWSENNFKQNHIDLKQHVLIRDNCLEWLARCKETFELIFLDPPSFSNSKKMEGTFDVQRDQLIIINDAMRILANDGVLIFSNNKRDFKLLPEVAERFNVEDITLKTIDTDFERDKKIHHCWLIRHKQ